MMERYVVSFSPMVPGENEEAKIFKEPEILERFKAIKAFKKEDKEKIYFTLDAVIHEVGNRKQYANK